MMVAAMAALALATGYAVAAAVAAPGDHDPRFGTIRGIVQHPSRSTRGVVKVFNGSGGLVARDQVSYSRDGFRFVLRPGRYKIKFRVTSQCSHVPPQTQTVRVRANHANHVTFYVACQTGY
jgi:hypothetical protein